MCMCSVCTKICNRVLLSNSVKLCFNAGFLVYLSFMVTLDIHMALSPYKTVLLAADLQQVCCKLAVFKLVRRGKINCSQKTAANCLP